MKILHFILIIISGSLFTCRGYTACPQAQSQHIKECGGNTIQELLQNGTHCDIATRLNEFGKWLESKDRPCSTIVKDIKTRYEFFRDTIRYPIDYSGIVFEGAADAPVKIVMYISLSCPLCKRVYRDLTDSLKLGNRSQKIALSVKPFSLSQMELALVATQKWKKQSEFLLALAPIKDRITMGIVMRIVDNIKIPRTAFNEEMSNKRTLTYVEASRVEALNNGVVSTPTIFINGKKYVGSKNARWVIDAAEYELLKR